MSTKARSFIVCVFLTIAFTGSMRSTVWAANEDETSISEFLSRLISQRSLLVSGDVIVRGQRTRRPVGESLNVASSPSGSVLPIFERFLFDHTAGLFRQEIEMWGGYREDAGPPQKKPPTQIRITGQTESYVKFVESRTIDILARYELNKVFDFRVMGMVTSNDLIRSSKLSELQAAFDRAVRDNMITVENEENPSLCLLTLLFNYHLEHPNYITGRRRIWIDTTRGFTPVKMIEQLNSEPFESTEIKWLDPVSTSTTEWKDVDGVWVPTSTSIEYLPLTEKGILDRINYDLAFDWQSVNADLEVDMFSLTSLDDPPGSSLISDRRDPLAGSQIVQHPEVAEARLTKRSDQQASINATKVQIDRNETSRLRVALLTLNALIIVAASIWYVARRFRLK